MATVKLVVKNVMMDVPVVSIEAMSDMWAQDALFSDHSYSKGTTDVYGFGSTGCVCYIKGSHRIQRQQWDKNKVLISVSVCWKESILPRTDETALYPF